MILLQYYFHSWLPHRRRFVHTFALCRGEDALGRSTKPQLNVTQLLLATVTDISRSTALKFSSQYRTTTAICSRCAKSLVSSIITEMKSAF